MKASQRRKFNRLDKKSRAKNKSAIAKRAKRIAEGKRKDKAIKSAAKKVFSIFGKKKKSKSKFKF